MSMVNNDYISLSEIRDFFKVKSRDSAYRILRKYNDGKNLPRIKSGKKIYFLRSRVEELFKKHTKEGRYIYLDETSLKREILSLISSREITERVGTTMAQFYYDYKKFFKENPVRYKCGKHVYFQKEKVEEIIKHVLKRFKEKGIEYKKSI